MRKSILLLFPLLFWHSYAVAQDLVSCSQLYEDAREAYAAGMVEVVPELLVPCLEAGSLTGTVKQEAYKLVINAYLFDYLPDEAGNMMERFIDDFPGYRAQPNDPAEFKLLLDARLRARGVDPDREVISQEGREQQEGIRTDEPRQVIRKPPFEYGNSMGFNLGFNTTFPLVVERYSIGDPTGDEGSFGAASGFQFGANMNLWLSEQIELALGIQFNRPGFKYSATPLSFASYTYHEYQSHLQLPVSMLIRLNPEADRISIYLRLGIIADYLLVAKGEGTRSYTDLLRDVTVEKMNITESRSRLNLHGTAGIGVRFPLENSFFFLETRFASGLFLVNRPENRYLNEDITWLIYHVDSDFKINQLSFEAGMAWNL